MLAAGGTRVGDDGQYAGDLGREILSQEPIERFGSEHGDWRLWARRPGYREVGARVGANAGSMSGRVDHHIGQLRQCGL